MIVIAAIITLTIVTVLFNCYNWWRLYNRRCQRLVLGRERQLFCILLLDLQLLQLILHCSGTLPKRLLLSNLFLQLLNSIGSLLSLEVKWLLQGKNLIHQRHLQFKSILTFMPIILIIHLWILSQKVLLASNHLELLITQLKWRLWVRKWYAFERDLVNRAVGRLVIKHSC